MEPETRVYPGKDLELEFREGTRNLTEVTFLVVNRLKTYLVPSLGCMQ